MAANHKFFNFYLILGNMLSAYVLIKICSCKYIGKLVGSIALIGLIFSGIIDFFPVYNDEVMTLQDIPANNVATWIKDNTPPDAIFLNSSYFFHPASIAGRKILLGWPYFSWSAGYNTDTRWSDMKTLYETTNPTLFCHLISKYHVSYISYQKPEVDNINPNITMLESQAEPVFTGQENTYFIYKLSTACYIRG